jgi:hypothetical protein
MGRSYCVAATVLQIAAATDVWKVYVGLTRHTHDACIDPESGPLDAICRIRQADPGMKPTSNDIREQLYREARQFREKAANVVDHVMDRSSSPKSGRIEIDRDDTSRNSTL